MLVGERSARVEMRSSDRVTSILHPSEDLMPSPAPRAPELVEVKRGHYVPGVGATLWELAACLRQHQQDPSPNSGSDDPSDAA